MVDIKAEWIPKTEVVMGKRNPFKGSEEWGCGESCGYKGGTEAASTKSIDDPKTGIFADPFLCPFTDTSVESAVIGDRTLDR